MRPYFSHDDINHSLRRRITSEASEVDETAQVKLQTIKQVQICGFGDVILRDLHSMYTYSTSNSETLHSSCENLEAFLTKIGLASHPDGGPQKIIKVLRVE